MELKWKANYHGDDGKLDGSCLNQFDEATGEEHEYKDIDRFRLARFDMIDEDNKAVFSLYLRKYQRLIYRRRSFIKLSGEKTHIYLVGWQQTITTPQGEKNITSICYLHQDGSVALDGHRSNLELLNHERY